ncbi:klaroid protein isoform X1 [Drosophila takahashii]|uniref:klaroid protein isoform X1 n=2 Tax=Drosophila takahashii TaxID=29030 RepID=UPI001CF81EC2|nr:uncharacterized protein LOC108061932 isoform X1 [Drosophila takahashii]
MSDDTYQIETRRRSRSKTPFLRSNDQGGEEGHVQHPKKKSAVPNVQTIVEEHIVESSSSSTSKKTRSKAFAQLTSDYSSDDMTPEAKRKQTSTKTTVTSIFTKLSGAATSTPRNRSQLETTQNTLNSAQEKLNHSNGNLSSGNVSDYLAYIEYRDAGEYWNKTPKTDYTYSELSPHRRQLAPGIVAMPNMSRRSLENHNDRVNYMVQQNPAQEEFIRRRYQSKYTQQQANYDSADELDATFGQQQQKQSWWLVRLIQLVISSVSTVWTRVTNISATETNAYQNYYARRQQSQQVGFLGKVGQAIGGGFTSLLRYLYIFIGSVLSLDTWLLRSSDAENKSKKRFLIFLLILLPLLLLTGWSLLQEDQRIGYVQRAEALLPLPLALFGSVQSRLSSARASLKSWLQVPTIKTTQEEAEAIKLNMASIESNIQKALTAEEYENILNHVNSYVQQLVELKMQQQSKELPPHQVQLIVQLMKENLQQFAQKTELNEKDLADLAIKLKLELKKSGDWLEGAKLSQANLEEITRLIKSEVHLHESHYTIQLERIDFAALLERILLAPELADFVDSRINAQVQKLQPKESSGSPPADIEIDRLNREIAFIKLALSDKQAENADLHQSISNLKLGQEDLLERMQQHELAQDRRFSGLLAEIESKLSALNDSQFALLNKQVKLSLVEILGFKQSTAGGAAGQLDDVDLQNWVRSMFVAKDYLEQQLLELNKRTNNNIRDEIERSSILLMSDISERLKREMLLVVEAKHNESTKALKGHIREEEVRQIVKTVLAIYDADKTGLVDFALESAGGQILSTRCTESYQTKSAQISVFGIPLWYPTNTPRVAISPNVQPGECWAFQGFPGFLVLKLNSLVYVTGFTLEHIPKSLSPTGRIDSAPRNFTVWGLVQEKDQEPVLFGEYQFEDNGASLQYFAVQNLDIKRPYEIVELRIETNHGQPTYTCLYRFRVHGKPPAT